MPSCAAPAAQSSVSAAWADSFITVAQIAGELQLAGALHDVDLHLQDLAAYLGPGQAVHHAHLIPCAMYARP